MSGPSDRKTGDGVKAFAVIALAASAVLLASDARAVKEKTLVYDYEGVVSYTRRGETQVVTLDMPVRAGDVFTTGADGKIDFTFHGMAGFRMAENGQCTVAKVGDSDMRVKADRGEFQVKLQPPSGLTTQFELETPGTRIVTKSKTQYVVIMKEEAGKGTVSTVAVRQGPVNVFVKIKSSALNLTDNQVLDVPSQGNSIPSIRSPDDGEAFKARQSNAIQFTEV